MYGPLVMASPDIHTWEEASLTLSPTLMEVKETGKEPFTLEVLGRKFVPDYYISDEQSTHYLRLDIPSGQRNASASGTLDTEELKRMLTTARRLVCQQAVLSAFCQSVRYSYTCERTRETHHGIRGLCRRFSDR